MIKNRCIKIISLLLVVVQFMVVAPAYVYAEDDEGTSPASLTPGIDLTPNIPSPSSNINIPIVVNFDATGIESYSFTAVGLTAVENESNPMQFELSLIDEFSTFELSAIDSNDVEHTSYVYGYKYQGISYISEVSQEQAWYDCHKARLDANIITLDEFNLLYDLLPQRHLEKDVPSGETPDAVSTTTTTIKGRIRLEDKYGNKEALAVARVELHRKLFVGSETIELETGNNYVYTNADGDYELKISNSTLDEDDELYIMVYLKSKTSKVSWEMIDCYKFETDIIDSVSIGATIDESYYIDYDSSSFHHKAACVHNCIVIAETFAISKGMPELDSEENRLRVVYPTLISGAYCYGFNDTCYWALIGWKRCNDIDAIAHEYAHYVQLRMGTYGANLGELMCYGTSHAFHHDQFETKNNDEFALKYSWLEAWASAFSVIVQCNAGDYDATILSYPLENPYNVNFINYCDAAYGAGFYEVEMFNTRCEAQEYAIAATLFDVFDNTPNEDLYPYDTSITVMDSLSVGYQTWWDITTEAGTYTLADFVNNFIATRPSDASELGKILASHNISPEIELVDSSSTVFSSSTRPTISWQGNGSEDNPHNYFEVRIYDEDGELLTSYVPDVTISGDHDAEYEHTIPQNKWNVVMNSFNCGDAGINEVIITVWAGKKDTNGDLYSGMFNSEYIYVDVNVSAGSAHSYTVCTSISATQHATYCEHCNALKPNSTASHTWAALGTTKVRCTGCGHTKAVGGLDPFFPIIKNELEEDEETE